MKYKKIYKNIYIIISFNIYVYTLNNIFFKFKYYKYNIMKLVITYIRINKK